MQLDLFSEDKVKFPPMRNEFRWHRTKRGFNTGGGFHYHAMLPDDDNPGYYKTAPCCCSECVTKLNTPIIGE
jgi:hypothetical protein